jgi:hypothetical protein
MPIVGSRTLQRSLPNIVQKLRSRFDAGYQPVISRPSAGDVEQVPLGVVDFFEIRVVADRFDSFLGWDHFVVASHHSYRAELQPFRQMHGANRGVAAGCLYAFVDGGKPDSRVFHQSRARERPLWDSGVRDALHHAAEAEDCDFPGLGPHSFRRANITWRQQVGGSSIEASKIAGHSDLEMTGEYTFVTPERQNELTRRIQGKLADAIRRIDDEAGNAHPASVPEVPPNLADATPATTVVQ